MDCFSLYFAGMASNCLVVLTFTLEVASRVVVDLLTSNKRFRLYSLPELPTEVEEEETRIPVYLYYCKMQEEKGKLAECIAELTFQPAKLPLRKSMGLG